jgi:uncharacterized integral membrane protein (TIGR00697 family)
MTNSLKLYVIFCSIFCTIIVTANLIFQKFVSISLFGNVLEISVGVMLYPITFLISDFVTEFYGKESARFMVNIAILCSFIVFILILVSDYCSATEWSMIDDAIFHKVFNVYGIGAIASIIANYLGQLVDIYFFSYLKLLTDGKYLWLRNNVSTILGQLVDTVVVISILCVFEIIPQEQFFIISLSSLSFKILAALADTPLCYLGYYLIRKSELAKTT